MKRRMFLRAVGLAGIGAAVAGCAGGDTATGSAPTDGSPTATSGGASAAPTYDPVGAVTDAEDVLSVVAATFEQLTGDAVPFAFGVLDRDNAPVSDADIAVHVVPVDGEPSGPYPAAAAPDASGRGGLYVAEIPFGEPVPTSVVAVTADGRAGSAAVSVTTPESSAFPAPGEEAPTVATPTAGAPLGAEQLCTADPPCGMHEVSLDEALAAGRPVVLEFATPAYCQTAFCGPSVDVLDEVRRDGRWGDVAFIHCEIYADSGQTLLEPVSAWNLPSEPWIYTIDADGRIVQRTDGPLLTLPEHVERIVGSVA